jgi:hypothetical protein
LPDLCNKAPTFPKYENYAATGLAKLVKQKQISPNDLIEAVNDWMDMCNPSYNSAVHTMYIEAFGLGVYPLFH